MMYPVIGGHHQGIVEVEARQLEPGLNGGDRRVHAVDFRVVAQLRAHHLGLCFLDGRLVSGDLRIPFLCVFFRTGAAFRQIGRKLLLVAGIGEFTLQLHHLLPGDVQVGFQHLDILLRLGQLTSSSLTLYS